MKHVFLLSALAMLVMMLSGCGGGGGSQGGLSVTLTGNVDSGCIIQVYEEGYAGNDEHLVASGTAGPDGNFSLTVPQEGVYDISFTNGYSSVLMRGEQLAAPATNLGAIYMPPPIPL
jgi:hypothetical protein